METPASVAIPVPGTDSAPDPVPGVEGVNGEASKGPPPPSPLTGCYLLIVVGEPHSQEHKEIILQRIAKGLLSWDIEECHVDLEKELQAITNVAPEGEEARHGERLIQFATENLVTEVLIHPAVSTLIQCMKNLLSSFTRHRHIIHSGYTFSGNGSWALQDGTFSLTDFCDAFQEHEVQRVLRAYDNTITTDLHCSPEGDWFRLPKEPFTKNCKLRVNPNDVLTSGSPSINTFLNYLSPYIVNVDVDTLLESSDVVGNIRFSHPTLYVFPGGQGDAALFGINGFNMLVDGGFARKACFWDFTRHLDRLDAVLVTRLNNSNVCGISAVLTKKSSNQVYPQIGHFFCNIQERKAISPDGDKDKDPLLINLLDEGHNIILNLRKLSLRPQPCYRDSEPINLYHKVGHGTLDMYVISPAKDSKEVREFVMKWNQNDQRIFAARKDSKELMFPLPNLVSICALLVWMPANSSDTITRLLFPGSTPQHKIFEGLDRLKHLEFMKHPTCTAKSLAAISFTKAKHAKTTSIFDRILPPEQKLQKILDNKPIKEKSPPQIENKQKLENKILSQNENKKFNNMNGGELIDEKILLRTEKVIKSDSLESEKSEPHSETKKNEINGKDVEIILENKSEIKTKPKTDVKQKTENKQQKIAPKTRSESLSRKSLDKKPKKIESKPSPTTPKKIIESKVNGVNKEKEPIKQKQVSNKIIAAKSSPNATPAKSTKDANNRKVVESKYKPAPKKTVPIEKKESVKTERKPISRRPKAASPARTGTKQVGSPRKPTGLDKNGISRAIKLEKEGTTDSSAVSTPSADQDITKLTKTELDELKAKELADLKEEQEVVKEIEAVFRKDEKQSISEQPDLRKIKDASLEDKTTEPEDEEEEYLIVEKEDIEQNTDSINEQESGTKEDEIQKHKRDSEESEKPRKRSDVHKSDEDEQINKQEIVDRYKDDVKETKLVEKDEDKIQEIISSVPVPQPPEMIKSKEDSREKIEEISKEISASPEDKIDVSSEKKLTDTRDIEEEDVKEAVVLESHPDEKFSTTIESGATTAPTLPEDERIPLDEIKEDHVIEEKHVKEETKEKEIPSVVIPTKIFETQKISPIVGMKFDAHQSHIRDIVKTPDEVADLPVHEEVDIDAYEFPGTVKKEKGEIKKSVDVKDNAEEVTELIKDTVKTQIEDATDEIIKKNDKIKDSVNEIKDAIQDKIDDTKRKIAQVVKEVEMKKEDFSDNILEKETVVEDESKNVIEFIKEINKITDEFKKHEDKLETKLTQITDKAENKNEKIAQFEIILSDVASTHDDNKKDEHFQKEQVSETKPMETVFDKHGDFKETTIESAMLAEFKQDHAPIISELDKTEMRESDIAQETVHKEILPKYKDIQEDATRIKVSNAVISDAKESVIEITKEFEENTDLLKKTNEKEPVIEGNEIKKILPDNVILETAIQTKTPKHDILNQIPQKNVEEEKDKIEGSISPEQIQREVDIVKLVSSVAHVLKSDAPLEELTSTLDLDTSFKPFSLPGYATTELRETHITTVESPIKEKPATLKEELSEICLKQSTLSFLEEERNKSDKEFAESKIITTLEENKMQGTESHVSITEEKIKDTQSDKQDDQENIELENQLCKQDSGAVHRMLVTASSEDGGEETVICPAGSITFTKTDSIDKSSPDEVLTPKSTPQEALSGRSTPEAGFVEKVVNEILSGHSTPEILDKKEIIAEKSLELTSLDKIKSDTLSEKGLAETELLNKKPKDTILEKSASDITTSEIKSAEILIKEEKLENITTKALEKETVCENMLSNTKIEEDAEKKSISGKSTPDFTVEQKETLSKKTTPEHKFEEKEAKEKSEKSISNVFTSERKASSDKISTGILSLEGLQKDILLEKSMSTQVETETKELSLEENSKNTILENKISKITEKNNLSQKSTSELVPVEDESKKSISMIEEKLIEVASGKSTPDSLQKEIISKKTTSEVVPEEKIVQDILSEQIMSKFLDEGKITPEIIPLEKVSQGTSLGKNTPEFLQKEIDSEKSTPETTPAEKVQQHVLSGKTTPEILQKESISGKSTPEIIPPEKLSQDILSSKTTPEFEHKKDISEKFLGEKKAEEKLILEKSTCDVLEKEISPRKFSIETVLMDKKLDVLYEKITADNGTQEKKVDKSILEDADITSEKDKHSENTILTKKTEEDILLGKIKSDKNGKQINLDKSVQESATAANSRHDASKDKETIATKITPESEINKNDKTQISVDLQIEKEISSSKIDLTSSTVASIESTLNMKVESNENLTDKSEKHSSDLEDHQLILSGKSTPESKISSGKSTPDKKTMLNNQQLTGSIEILPELKIEVKSDKPVKTPKSTPPDIKSDTKLMAGELDTEKSLQQKTTEYQTVDAGRKSSVTKEDFLNQLSEKNIEVTKDFEIISSGKTTPDVKANLDIVKESELIFLEKSTPEVNIHEIQQSMSNLEQKTEKPKEQNFDKSFEKISTDLKEIISDKTSKIPEEIEIKQEEITLSKLPKQEVVNKKIVIDTEYKNKTVIQEEIKEGNHILSEKTDSKLQSISSQPGSGKSSPDIKVEKSESVVFKKDDIYVTDKSELKEEKKATTEEFVIPNEKAIELKTESDHKEKETVLNKETIVLKTEVKSDKSNELCEESSKLITDNKKPESDNFIAENVIEFIKNDKLDNTIKTELKLDNREQGPKAKAENSILRLQEIESKEVASEISIKTKSEEALVKTEQSSLELKTESSADISSKLETTMKEDLLEKSEKSSPDQKLVEKKSIPDVKSDITEKLASNHKMEEDSASTTSDIKCDITGRLTPDHKIISTLDITDLQDSSEKSGKSTPDQMDSKNTSGKTTPDIKSERKKSQDICETHGNSEEITSNLKTKSGQVTPETQKDNINDIDSGKSSPELKEDIKSTSQKSTPEPKLKSIAELEGDIKEIIDDVSKTINNFGSSNVTKSTPDFKLHSEEVPKIEKVEVKITKISTGDESKITITETVDLSVAGPSHVQKDDSISSSGQISPLNRDSEHLSSEDLHLSGKSTPDIADVERMKEMHEILKHEKHIPGSSTPPTVPVSPIVKETFSLQSEAKESLQKEERQLQPEGKSEQHLQIKPIVDTKTKETIESATIKDIRSSTPGSDEYELGGVSSPPSDVSSGQMSRVAHIWGSSEERQVYSDEEDIPGSPTSVTSQVAHSPSFVETDYEVGEISHKTLKQDPMSASLYGNLPDEPEEMEASGKSQPIPITIAKSHYKSEKHFLDEADLDFEKAMQQHRHTRGADLIASLPFDSASYKYEITTAKFHKATKGAPQESEKEEISVTVINKNGLDKDYEIHDTKTETRDGIEIITSTYIQGTLDDSEPDPIESWGKPLGLPSPAPPTNDVNKTTPKKVPPYLTAKNKLNDEKKRSDSPSKYDRKTKKLNPLYMDLTYVPHHGNSNYSYVDFFKRVRARYYVFSGIEPSREVYNALLEAKQTWDDKDLEVTIIPTYDTDVLGYWVAENEDLLAKYKIDLSPSASRCTINLQDHETSCSAYRLEF